MNPREPVRLRETDSEASSELRELLDSASGDEPTPAQLSALAQRLAPLLTPPGGAPLETSPVSPTTPPGTGTLVTATGVKLKVLVGLAATALAAGSFQAGRVFERERAAPPPAVVATPTPAPEPVAPVPPPPAEEPVPPPPLIEPVPPVAPPRPARPHGPEAKPTARVPVEASVATDEELVLLESAYGALRKGDAGAALAAAGEHAKRFADGALAQEREVLAIDALLRLERREEAEARARAFRARYPTSTHWVRIQGLLSGSRP